MIFIRKLFAEFFARKAHKYETSAKTELDLAIAEMYRSFEAAFWVRRRKK